MQNQNLKPRNDLKYRAYQYSIEMIKFLDSLPKDASTDIIAKQLLRSSTSIGANVIEAKGSSSKRDFTNFFGHSMKSANESLYWLGLLRDAKEIKHQKLDYLLNEMKELANILGSSILTLKGKKKF
jgi:four helix bundle protein